MFYRRPRAPEPVGIKFLDDAPVPPRPATPPPAAPRAPVAPAPAPAPAPKARRQWPVGTMAFLTVFGTGLVLQKSGAPIFPGSKVRMEDQVSRAFTVAKTPNVVVEVFNGAVEVTKGETGKVEGVVEVWATADDEPTAEAALKMVKVAMVQEGDTIRVTARRAPGASPRSSGTGAAAKIQVPDGAAVQIKTDNGPISVRGVEGPVNAHSVNGRIEVKDGTGIVALGTNNGPIRCEASDAVVTADSSNGEINFEGSLAKGASTFGSGNGKITLRLPDRQSFRVDAQTGNGKISTDFDVNRASNNSSKSKRLVGTVGENPEVNIKVRSGNGSIRIEEGGN